MPELPEVETIVNDLTPHLTGRRVIAIALFDAKVVPQGFTDFEARLVGQRIEALRRRAKYIVGELSSGERLVVHLGMTGRLLLRQAGTPEDRFTRLILTLDDGHELRYADQRKFGHLAVVSAAEWTAQEARLGPEPLSDAFAIEAFVSLLAHRKGALKPLLLNQRLLAGLGNIYADEALFEAGLHPERSAATLTSIEAARLHASIRAVLRRAITNRGTTFSDYRDGRGRPGENQRALAVYKRRGQPCPQCGEPVERVRVGGRSSHYCPKCQA